MIFDGQQQPMMPQPGMVFDDQGQTMPMMGPPGTVYNGQGQPMAMDGPPQGMVFENQIMPPPGQLMSLNSFASKLRIPTDSQGNPMTITNVCPYPGFDYVDCDQCN